MYPYCTCSHCLILVRLKKANLQVQQISFDVKLAHIRMIKVFFFSYSLPSRQTAVNNALWVLAAHCDVVAGHPGSNASYLAASTSDLKYTPVRNGNGTSDLSQTIFLGQLVRLCVFTTVYASSVSIPYKGILSPPSWSYQSLAELCGVGKVIHTTGGSIHTADFPQCCLLCLFDSVEEHMPFFRSFGWFS